MQRHPYLTGVIAECANELGVQEAVRKATARGLPVALKSGGHSFEGFCLNADGMVLELSRLSASFSFSHCLRAFSSLLSRRRFSSAHRLASMWYHPLIAAALLTASIRWSIVVGTMKHVPLRTE